MPKFLKVSKRLFSLLEEEALVVSGDGAQAGDARVETSTIQWDPEDATTALNFKRTVKLNAAGRTIESTAWLPDNVPTIASVENAALGDAAQALLDGTSTLTIKSVGDAAVYGASAANLEVWISLPSDHLQYCTPPGIRAVYKGKITSLVGANTITVEVTFPKSEGVKSPGKGTAEIIVRNIKQQAQSDSFLVEIV